MMFYQNYGVQKMIFYQNYGVQKHHFFIPHISFHHTLHHLFSLESTRMDYTQYKTTFKSRPPEREISVVDYVM